MKKLVDADALCARLDEMMTANVSLSAITALVVVKGTLIPDLPDASQPLRERVRELEAAAKPALIALMREMSEERWCAGWQGDLGKSLIAGEGGMYPDATADYQPPDQGDFDRLVLLLGEVPELAKEGYNWRPLTAEERAVVEARLKEAGNA